MIPQTERIRDQHATLFREGKHPVYLLNDGRFAVKWEGLWMVRTSMKAIDNVIGKNLPSVRIFNVSSGYVFHDCQPKIVQARTMEQNKIVDSEGKRHFRGQAT